MPLVIASAFTIAGFWPILPFAGLEVALLGCALYWSMRKTRVREFVRVDERCVLIRKHEAGRDVELEFSRYWTQVRLVRPKATLWPSRLLLKSKGRSVEIGSFLTNDERDGLKHRLSEVIESDR
jgi:uncharacterized membrane protein